MNTTCTHSRLYSGVIRFCNLENYEYTVRRKIYISEPSIMHICILITLLFETTELTSLFMVQPILLNTSASIRFTSA